MRRSVEILEVGPRDGLQLEPSPVTTEIKIELLRRLVSAGLKRIEAVSFVSPKKVPQMADAEALLDGCVPAAREAFAGLIVNQRDLERAIAPDRR